MTKPRGFILYQGPSQLTGDPIVVIATLKTKNGKTGNLVQTWILRSDMHPLDAAKSGADSAICGNCSLAPSKRNTCYVNIGQAPAAVYRAFMAGVYPVATQQDLKRILQHRKLRLGAYGDPAAAPFPVWENATNIAREHVGYTHQAAHKNYDPRFNSLVMLSAETPKQALKYQSQGAHTFRVKMPNDSFLPGELECLADSAGVTCHDCMLCDGQTTNVAIDVHGSTARNFSSPLVGKSPLVIATDRKAA